PDGQSGEPVETVLAGEAVGGEAGIELCCRDVRAGDDRAGLVGDRALDRARWILREGVRRGERAEPRRAHTDFQHGQPVLLSTGNANRASIARGEEVYAAPYGASIVQSH